jgi:N-acetylglutamate synthase-like GNAT family acetyltransferase
MLNPAPEGGARHSAGLRPAETDDLAAVLALLRSAGLPTAGVAAALSNFFVMESGGLIVAAGGLEMAGDSALLRSLVVADSHRGRRIGIAMVAALLGEARQRKLSTIWLLTESAPTFFEKLGFRHTERDQAPIGLQATVEFTDCCPASAKVMMLRLFSSP